MRELYVIILFLGVISHGVYFFINKFIATLDVSDYILEGTRNITPYLGDIVARLPCLRNPAKEGNV